jgi:hypothetical protein
MEKRVRSPNYPGMSLPDAIGRIQMLYKAQHTHAAPREVIAKGIGYNSLNGASATAISAIGKYGFLERSGDEGFKLSERAMSIIAPHSSAEKAEAIRAAAMEPKLFAELFERFPPPLPNDEVLRNYLIRAGFAPAAVSPAVLAYRETMDLVDREGPAYHSAPATPDVDAPMDAMATTPSSKNVSGETHFCSSNRPGTRDLGRWPFEDGTWVQILAAENVDTEQALDMAELLIQIRRKELKKRKSASSESGSHDENNPT